MRILLLVILLSLIVSVPVNADMVYDKILAAIRNNAAEDNITELRNKYTDKKISGEGYISDITEPTSNLREIILSETKDGSGLTNVVNITVRQFLSSLEANPQWDFIKRLKEGEKVSFSGDLFDIFSNTIYIKGDVRIEKALER